MATRGKGSQPRRGQGGGVREWVIVALIGALVMGLYYTNAFDLYDDNITICEQHNDAFREVNARTPKFNALFKVEREEEEHRKDRARLTPVKNVSLSDCEGDFSKPWPFG